jgi:hypothetical protein
MADKSNLVFINADGEIENSTVADRLVYDGGLKSADGTTSAQLDLKSGDASAGDSGDVRIQAGTATGTRGSIVLDGAEIDANSTNIINLTDPNNPQDAATKNYVDTQGFGTGDGDLKSDGTVPMAAPFDLAGNNLSDVNLITDSLDNTSIDVENRQLETSVGVMMDWSGTEIDFQAKRLTNIADPTDPQDAATKIYVDGIAAGIDLKESVRVATDEALPTYTPSGAGVGKTLTANAAGVLTVDDVATVLGDRILVKNENGAQGAEGADADHGIYEVTTEGTIGVAFVLTRTVDFDGTPSGEVSTGSFAFVREGTENANSGWAVITPDPITLDTTPVTFSQFQGLPAYVGGNGITILGNDVSVDHDGQGLQFLTNQLALELDGNSLEKSATGLKLNFSTLYTEADKAIAADKINSTANGQGASIVGIEDPSNYYSGLSVEAALDEIETQIGGLTSTTFAFTEDNVLVDNDAIYAALDKLDLKWGDLASPLVSEGASLVGINDSLNYYTSSNTVETALDEIAGQIGGTSGTTFAFTEDNVLTDNDAIYAALDKLDLKWGDLASVANGEGASLVGLEDNAGLYVAADVEAALEEVMLLALSGGAESYTVATGGINAGDLIVFTGPDEVTEIDNQTGSAVEFAFAVAATTQLATESVNALHDGQRVVGALTGSPVAFVAGDKVYYDSSALGAARYVTLNNAPSGAGSKVWQIGIAASANDLVIDINFIKKNA